MLEQIDDTHVMFSSFSYDYDSYIQFEAAGNKVQGLASCDAISGEFSLTGTKSLSFARLGTTAGNCSSPYIARLYLAALPTTTRYEIVGNKLYLFDAQTAKPRLIFHAPL
jgi:heat shock protein HslJ